ncbi:MAG: glycerate kinase [Solirubrobacterales bacterium]
MSERPARYLVAPDSFKGTFDAGEVAAAIGAGLEQAGAAADLCPIADGGEGTIAALLAKLGGRRVEAEVHDPLRRPIVAEFALLAGERTAVVEVAAATGLPLLAPEERDAEGADSFGTGELIAAAIAAGARKVLVAAGGSASTDGGRGAIEAIGGRRGLGDTELEVLCDTETPYEDAARVFAPQKGADEEAVARLTERLREFAETLPRDPRGLPMSGCAGGLSGGLYGALGARLRPGALFVLRRADFSRRLRDADAVITGEGKIDEQSLDGKAVGTVAELCAAAGKPLHVIAAVDALDPEAAANAGIASVRSATSLAAITAMARAIAADGARTAAG